MDTPGNRRTWQHSSDGTNPWSPRHTCCQTTHQLPYTTPAGVSTPSHRHPPVGPPASMPAHSQHALIPTGPHEVVRHNRYAYQASPPAVTPLLIPSAPLSAPQYSCSATYNRRAAESVPAWSELQHQGMHQQQPPTGQQPKCFQLAARKKKQPSTAPKRQQHAHRPFGPSPRNGATRDCNFLCLAFCSTPAGPPANNQ